ncbi:TPA: hypothetical protein ACH3X2_008668 [Trebouxia sp. C0005]
MTADGIESSSSKSGTELPESRFRHLSRSPSPASATESPQPAIKFEAKKRKLWKRLYADLNRAVDDLYTLTEMDGNLWQARNIVQLLDESTADFRQLQAFLQSQGCKEGGIHESGAWPTRKPQSSPRHGELFQQLLSCSGLSPDPGNGYSIPALRPSTYNTCVISSSHSAPEPSSRAASPVRHSSLRPTSASAVMSTHAQQLSFEESLSDVTTGNASTKPPDATKTGVKEALVMPSLANKADACFEDLRVSRMLSDEGSKPAAGQASSDETVPCAWQEAQDWAELLDHDSPVQQDRADTMTAQPKLMSPHWQRKSPSELQQQLKDKHAAAAQRRNLQQVQKKARQARAQAGREAVQNVEQERKLASEQQLQQKQARKAQLRDAHLKSIRRKALDETTKVHEVLFINKLQKEDKELTLMQRMQDAERRQAEARAKQQKRQRELEAAQQEAQERRLLLEEQKLHKLAEKERRATAVALKLENERRAGETARLAKAEQHRAVQQHQKQAAQEHVQQLEARLALRLQEAAQRRVSHLDQIKERAAISKEEKEACPPMSPPKTHRGHLRSSPEPIQSEDKAVSLATTTSNRLKGMRRRAAKLLARIQADSLHYSQQATAHAARQEGAGSKPLACLLGSMQQSAQREDIAGLEADVPEMQQCLDRHHPHEAALNTSLLMFITQAVAAPHSSWPDRLNTAFGQVLLKLLACEDECQVLLASGHAVGLVQQLALLLDHFIAEEGADKGPCRDSAMLDALLQAVRMLITPLPLDNELSGMRDHVIGYILACGTAHRLNELFSLFDKPQGEKAAPFPSFVVQALHLLQALTSQLEPSPLQADTKRRTTPSYGTSIILTLKEVGLAGMLSLLTAVLLHATASGSPASSEPDYTALPHNFCAVAELVLRVISNAALLDLPCLQRLLGSADLRIEIFHVISFLLMFATRQWTHSKDQVTGLMREVLLFVGLFAVSEPRNQSVLLWGKAPTAVHKLCLLSQSLQDDFQMANSLDCTLLAVCASNYRVCEVMHEHLDLDRLNTYVHNCLEGSRELPEADAPQAEQGSNTLPDKAVCADQQSRLHDTWRYHQQHRFPCTVLQDAQNFLNDVLADDPA